MTEAEKQLRGISDDAIEAAAKLVERLGKLQKLQMLSAEHFAVIAAADIRFLKSGSDGETTRPAGQQLNPEK